MAESDMGVRSNYMAMLKRPGDDNPDTRVEAARAQRRITEWLTAVGDYDAGVLKAAYEAKPWGLSLREAVGRATGVMVRLAAAEVGLPEDDGKLAELEVKTAERLSECFESQGLAGLEAYRPKAVTLLQRAYRSYVRERGGKEVPSVWGGL